jgi:HEAT repeat protein
MFESIWQIRPAGTETSAVMDMDSKDDLIAGLAASSWHRRQQAREALELRGRTAVPSLIMALSDARQQVRWEAASILLDIGDPAAAPALASRLEDEDAGVRWLAAEGLAVMGCQGLVVALKSLIAHSDSAWTREGVYHVLRRFGQTRFGRYVKPVMRALRDVEPDLGTLPAAQVALDAVAVDTGCSQ